MKHTIIAVFDSVAHAQKAADDLVSRGFEHGSVHVSAQTGEAPEVEPLPAASFIEGGPASGLLHRLAMLFGVNEPHVAHYREAVRRGGTVVKVDADDEAQATAARDALIALGAANIDDRVEEWRKEGWTGAVPSGQASNSANAGGAKRDAAIADSPAGGAEGVVVHRQEVSLGGVRVYGHTAVLAFDDYADDFRSDYAARYAADNGAYDDFDPAYRYGHALAADNRYGRRSWDEIESEARTDWERRYPQSPWERFKGAVRHAWERVSR